MKSNTSLVLAFAYCLVVSSLQSPSASAQITPDGSTYTTVKVNGNNFEIDNGDHIGDNIFHSFEQFSVPTLGSAAFNNASDIVNIFSRVTGNSISDIDGLISANGTANLFLINPNGIIFGENASLNLGGSFFASTADSLLFENNLEFSAVNPQAPPLLKVNMPIGLNLGNNPGEIVNRSYVQNSAGDFVGLEVAPGENLTLVGGNINFERGQATARGGNIELGGLSAAGTVGISEDGSLNFPEDVARADITLSNAADVDVRGTGGGNIIINARNLNLEAGNFGSSVIRAGITADSTSVDAQAGDITINATDNVTVDDSSIPNQVELGAVGDAGGVTINTGSLSLTNGGIVDARTFGRGNAGSLEITATDTISVDGETSDGFPSLVTSQVISGAMGDTGGITINTGSLSLTNGGAVSASTEGQGNVASVEITATEGITIDGQRSNGLPSRIRSQVSSDAVGNSGGIFIDTTTLSLTNGGRILAITFGEEDAGLVQINATEGITLDGETSNGQGSIIFSVVATGAVGNSEGILIDTTTLSLTNGGRISSLADGEGDGGMVRVTASGGITIDGETSTVRESAILSVVGLDVEGNSRGILIDTTTLSLTNGGEISSTSFGEGDAGAIQITATEGITLDGQKSNGFPTIITSQADGGTEGKSVGNSGEILINTSTLSLINGGRITASTFGAGDAGRVQIIATEGITLDGETRGGLSFSSGLPSNISSTVGFNIRVGRGAEGNSGEILIDTTTLSLTNGGQVSTSTLGQGNAGDVTVKARELIFISGVTEDNRSGLSADAFISNGNGGDVNVFTNQLTIDDGGTIAAGNFDSLGVFEPGTGEPGNINIQANSLNMSNQASIEAATQSEIGEGANINLTIAEDIIFKNNSLISARALQNADGGNVTINASDGFIIAFPNQNNDIIANAQQGNGGRINISTQAIFGLEERRSTPPNQTNDIDASSEFGLQGEITINTPEADPTKGLIELPESVGDASDQISQNPCERGIDSKFISTGKGGLRPNPTETLSSREVWKDVQLPTQLIKNSANTVKQSNTTPERIVEASSWIINEEGIVELVAEKSSATHQDSCR